MSATLALIGLAGSIALLLWGLHMVESGAQRACGPYLRRFLGHALGNRGQAFLVGFGVTAILQSSTATGLMDTSFAAGGLVGLVPALAVMLGANLGTTLVVQLLSFNIGRVAPLFVLIGGDSIPAQPCVSDARPRPHGDRSWTDALCPAHPWAKARRTPPGMTGVIACLRLYRSQGLPLPHCPEANGRRPSIVDRDP